VRNLIREIISRAFSRMTTYLSIFNFCMLCMWLYDSDITSFFRDNGLRPGDVIVIILFSILVITVIEMAILGFNKETE
jgi:uncharacterized membrane protein